jgi:hypothetical protein
VAGDTGENVTGPTVLSSGPTRLEKGVNKLKSASPEKTEAKLAATIWPLLTVKSFEVIFHGDFVVSHGVQPGMAPTKATL